jgi:hypothetical protein
MRGSKKGKKQRADSGGDQADLFDQQSTEEGMASDLADLQASFAQRAKLEKERIQTTVDSEYWVCISFDSRQQKHAFLRAMGWDKLGNKFLDGVELAKLLGVELPATPPALRFLREASDPMLDELT